MPAQSAPGLRVRRFTLTIESDLSIHRLLADLRRATGSNVDFSTMTRALWMLAVDAGESLRATAREEEVGRRHRNGDLDGQRQYEATWVRLLSCALSKPPTVPLARATTGPPDQ